MAVTRRTALVPLFLVSLAAVGYETALTRYFAVAKWSEYGYWVISIVMVGFAFSGVVLALFRDAFARHGETLLASLPALLVATAAVGFHFTTTNPFNPLQLQNPGDLGAAALEHRRVLRVPAAVLLPRRHVRQPELRAECRPYRPGLRLRPDRRGCRRGCRAGGDVRGARVLPGAGAAGAAGRERLLRGGAPALAGRGGGRCCAARRRGAAAARQPGGIQRLQGDLCAAAHARRTRGRQRTVAARRLHAAGRFHRAGGHRHLQQRRHAGRAGAAAHLRPVSRRQPHRGAAETRRAECRLRSSIAGCAAVSADPARKCAAGGRIGRLPHPREVLALGAAHVHVLEPEPVLLRVVGAGARAVTRLGQRQPGDACLAPGRWRLSATAAATTSSTCRPISSMPRRPTSRRSRCRRSWATCGRCGRAGSCPFRCRSATFRSMRCACWRPRGPHCLLRASAIRRRTSSCIARRGAPASCCPTGPGTPRVSPRCGSSATSARSTCRGIRAWIRSRRAAASTTTCRRSRSPAARSPPTARTIPSPMRPVRCWPMPRRRRDRPSTWRRSHWTDRSSTPCCGWISSTRSCSGWRFCRRRRSARWSISRCWRRRW